MQTHCPNPQTQKQRPQQKTEPKTAEGKTRDPRLINQNPRPSIKASISLLLDTNPNIGSWFRNPVRLLGFLKWISILWGSRASVSSLSSYIKPWTLTSRPRTLPHLSHLWGDLQDLANSKQSFLEQWMRISIWAACSLRDIVWVALSHVRFPWGLGRKFGELLLLKLRTWRIMGLSK